jgi:hypothetical protein
LATLSAWGGASIGIVLGSAVDAGLGRATRAPLPRLPLVAAVAATLAAFAFVTVPPAPDISRSASFEVLERPGRDATVRATMHPTDGADDAEWLVLWTRPRKGRRRYIEFDRTGPGVYEAPVPLAWVPGDRVAVRLGLGRARFIVAVPRTGGRRTFEREEPAGLVGEPAETAVGYTAVTLMCAAWVLALRWALGGGRGRRRGAAGDASAQRRSREPAGSPS